MPKALVACQNRAHVLISLRTFNPKQASSLAAQLDALLDDLTTMPDARLLTQPQLDGMLRDVLVHHLAKLERVAAVEKLERGFNRNRAERDDRRTAWVYRLLEFQGPGAQVSHDDREAILADGFDEKDVESIVAHLHRLQDGKLVPTKPHVLRPLLEAQNAEPIAANLAQAQQIYFRGMRLALEQTAARYRAVRPDDDALVAGIIRGDAERRVAEVSQAPLRGDPGPARPERNAGAAPGVPPFPGGPCSVPASATPTRVDDGIVTLGELLGRQTRQGTCVGRKDGETGVTALRPLSALHGRGVRRPGPRGLRQQHLARFINFLQFEVYTHYGKSADDETRTIAELRRIAARKAEDQRGVQPPTLNRHLTFLNQLLDYARAKACASTRT